MLPEITPSPYTRPRCSCFFCLDYPQSIPPYTSRLATVIAGAGAAGVGGLPCYILQVTAGEDGAVLEYASKERERWEERGKGQFSMATQRLRRPARLGMVGAVT
jgi:hypothetical protein